MEVDKLKGLCLHVLCGYKHRDIAAKFSISASLVSIIKHRLADAQLTASSEAVSKVTAMTDKELATIVYPTAIVEQLNEDKNIKVGRPKVNTLMPDFKAIANTILDSHVSKKFCYIDYLSQCESQQLAAISRSDFYAKLNIEMKRINGPKVYMPQEHPYGNEVCIDFCGDNFYYYEQGEKKKGTVCVLTWSASYYTFAIIIPSQKTEDTCYAVGKAFQFFGYLPLILQCDNFKSMVTTHKTGAEALFNESFKYFVERLGMVPIASNPYSPSQKSCVEAMVGMVQRNVLPRIPDDPSKTIFENNAMLMELVNEQINRAPYRSDTDKTREFLFKTYEISRARKFEGIIPVFYRRLSYLRVDSNYRVEIDGHKYSVPFKYATRYVTANISGNIITIIYEGEVIATHTISYDGKDTVKLEHMPENHRSVAEKKLKYPDVQSIINKAKSLSPQLERFCNAMLKNFGFDNGKRACIRIINCYVNKSKFPPFIMDEAIERLFINTPDKWNSNYLLQIFDEVRDEVSVNGSYEHQTTLDFTADPSQTFLRGAGGAEALNEPHQDTVEDSSTSSFNHQDTF